MSNPYRKEVHPEPKPIVPLAPVEQAKLLVEEANRKASKEHDLFVLSSKKRAEKSFFPDVLRIIRRRARRGETSLDYGGGWWHKLNEHSSTHLASLLKKEGFNVHTKTNGKYPYEHEVAIYWS